MFYFKPSSHLNLEVCYNQHNDERHYLIGQYIFSFSWELNGMLIDKSNMTIVTNGVGTVHCTCFQPHVLEGFVLFNRRVVVVDHRLACCLLAIVSSIIFTTYDIWYFKHFYNDNPAGVYI